MKRVQQTLRRKIQQSQVKWCKCDSGEDLTLSFILCTV